ncbi:MAG: hypothetical protein DI604_28165 [Delftia acidovorans]|nr:MAG: hypothetical protein DI604_28165 [Delftia acidovorans]
MIELRGTAEREEWSARVDSQQSVLAKERGQTVENTTLKQHLMKVSFEHGLKVSFRIPTLMGCQNGRSQHVLTKIAEESLGEWHMLEPTYHQIEDVRQCSIAIATHEIGGRCIWLYRRCANAPLLPIVIDIGIPGLLFIAETHRQDDLFDDIA